MRSIMNRRQFLLTALAAAAATASGVGHAQGDLITVYQSPS